MIELPERARVFEFRTFLDACGYNTDNLTQQIGRARPPAEGEREQMFDDSRQITTLNVLVRLFLLGAPVDDDTVSEFLPEPVVRFCQDVGMLEAEAGVTTGRIVIIPVDDLLFVSDAFHILGTDEVSEFVLPASTHSANFLRLLTLREPVEETLDLGCGCGIHALFSARHSTRVTATDISSRAILYTRFNAMLNDIDNVECIEGSLFDPVAGRQFDLVISNPPFVLGPSETFVYRDNDMELDRFCETLVGAAPAHLKDGGHLQILCEWVEVEGQGWQDRISGWIFGCDAWVLHATPLSPASYVQHRTSDISGEAITPESDEDWRSYFADHKVRAIHPGLLVLRRRDGTNWLHVQNLPGDVVSPAGKAIADGIAAVDFLESCDDESLIDATLRLAEDLDAEQVELDGETSGVCLRLQNGLMTEAEIDGAVAAFLNLFDGKRSVLQCAGEFAAVADADVEQLTNDLLSIVRVFVSRGFLIPVDFA
jgi:methylase of polypeptide subunit release factors